MQAAMNLRRSLAEFASAIEFALIVLLVAIVVIALLMILGPNIGDRFDTINKSLTSV
jgi:Flp pilus assembly pilin Flp